MYLIPCEACGPIIPVRSGLCINCQAICYGQAVEPDIQRACAVGFLAESKLIKGKLGRNDFTAGRKINQIIYMEI